MAACQRHAAVRRERQPPTATGTREPQNRRVEIVPLSHQQTPDSGARPPGEIEPA
jgi:hypothetical protein